MMGLFNSTPRPMAHTLRVLARLLAYPGPDLLQQLPALRDALHAESALDRSRLAEIDRLLQRLQHAEPLDAEAAYVELFDRGRGTALHLFEHVHGDSRERGPAMIDLVKMYEAAGLLLAPGELPDHLCVLLEYASTQPPAQSRALLAEFTHILQNLLAALLRRHSAYAGVMAALLDLAGVHTPAVKLPPADAREALRSMADPAPAWDDTTADDEATLDETWEEPPAFGGCSTQGQARPGQPQPIQIVRRPGATTNAATPNAPGVHP